MNKYCQSKIITVGSVNIDLVTHAERIAAPGETIRADDFFTNPGGKGANQAVAVAKLGGISTFLARVGDDGYGRDLKASLKKYGVNTSLIKTTQNCSSGMAMITITADGENSIIIVGGANDRLTADDVKNVEDEISSADALMVQLEVPLGTVKEALRLAKKHNVITVLDPAPVPKDGIPDEFFDVDIFSPNKSEVELLSGLSISNDEDIVKAGTFFISKGAKLVVMKLGSYGALIINNDGDAKHVPAYKVQAVDTTAAGDAFTAGMTLSFIETGSIEDAVRFACATGALTVLKLGAQQAIPDRKQLSDFLKKNS